MICPTCGTENRDDARFCYQCGYAFVQAAATGRLGFVPSPLDAPLPDDERADTADLDEEVPTETLAFESGAFTPAREPMASDTLFIGTLDPDLADIGGVSEPAALTSPLKPPSETQEMPKIGEVADIQKKSYIATPAGKSASGKGLSMPKLSRIPSKGVLALIIAIVVVLLGAGIAFGTYSMQLWGGKQVPNVIGLKADDATVKLEAAGFTVSQVLVKSDDVEGIVLSSSPEPDQRAEAGSEVTIDVSCARTVPDVLGLSQEEALSLLQQEGFENVEVAEQKSNEAAGSVIAVSPEVGIRSKAQATISLTVAVPFVVPEVAGLSLEEAEAALAAEGYEVTTATVYSEEVDEGSILGTDPEAGTQLPSGSTVCINIAKSRAAEVAGYARAWFNGGKDYSMNGLSYELKSVDAITYKGDDTCAFTVTMRPYETHSWFGSQPETRYGNDQKINGTMRFSSDGQLESIDPALKRN